MKTFIYIALFLYWPIFYTAQNLYLGINDIIVSQPSEQQIKVKLLVTGGTYGNYQSYISEVNQNQITLSVCYLMTDAAAMTYFDNDFYVDIPSSPNNYDLTVKVYFADGMTCNYINLDDTATLYFSTPIGGTVSLATNDKHLTNIQLFPIPAKDELNFKTKEKFDHINLYDASGRKLPVKFENNKINTSSLQNGIYFLEILLGNKKIHRKFTVSK